MFRSNTKASALISRVKSEIEVLDIPEDAVFYDCLNRFLAGLYSSVITDIREARISKDASGVYTMSYVENGSISPMRVCDIVKVSDGAYEYERVGMEYSPELCPEGEHLYKMSEGGVLSVYLKGQAPSEMKVYFRAIPPLHTAESDREIELPEEFTELVAAKLLSDIYRYLGEDELCANWTEEYNTQMARFGVWLEVHGA